MSLHLHLIPLSGLVFKPTFYTGKHFLWSRVISGIIVSDYGLDDRGSVLCVQTGSGAHPASCAMGTGGPFPTGKARPGRDADHSSPSSAEVVNEYRSYISSPPQAPSRRVAGLLYFCFTYFLYSQCVSSISRTLCT
jgi:hypothetical protein